MAFAIGGTLSGLHGADVRDVAVVANGIVVDEVAHFLDETVVAHRDIAQRGVVDARTLGESLGHLHLFLEHTQTDVAIEHNTVETIW